MPGGDGLLRTASRLSCCDRVRYVRRWALANQVPRITFGALHMILLTTAVLYSKCPWYSVVYVVNEDVFFLLAETTDFDKSCEANNRF